MVAPEPCFIVMIWPPVVAFSIIHTLDTVLGPKVRVLVAVKLTADVNFKYMDRTPSVEASGIVKVSSESAATCFVP